jgi:hypothetical protein
MMIRSNKIFRNIAVLLLLLLAPSSSAQKAVDPLEGALSPRLANAFKQIGLYNQSEGVILPGAQSKTEITDNAVVFTDILPLEKPVDSHRDPDKKMQDFSVSTIFLRQSPTVEKRVHIRQGPEEMSRMRFIYTLPRKNDRLFQHTVQNEDQLWQIYEGKNDIFFYTQTVTGNGEVQVKEWIYAERPNAGRKSVYEWKLFNEEFNRFLEMEAQEDGSVAILRHVKVSGAKDDPAEHKRIVKVVREALKKVTIRIHGEDKVGEIQPVKYWTSEGLEKTGTFSVRDSTALVVLVDEPASAYPLVIDPNLLLKP